MVASASEKPLLKGGKVRGARVLIVDDSLTVRGALTRSLSQDPAIEVVATAGSGERALHELGRRTVDVVLLDLEMPGMGGMEALPRMLAMHPGLAVIVISSLTEAGARHSVEALAMGAADTILKPRPGEFTEDWQQALIDRIHALSARHGIAPPEVPAARQHLAASEEAPRPAPHLRSVGQKAAVKGEDASPGTLRLIAIGASTGGIHALGQFLKHLPDHVALPILVTQHLPEAFMPVFARQLADISGRPATIAEEGAVLECGSIAIAPGNAHLAIRCEQGPNGPERIHCSLNDNPAPSGFMPSLDPMFTAIAAALPGQAIGIVLSGMGSDGSAGAALMHRCGNIMLVQDKASSAVWGMPRVVAQAGHAHAVMAPDRIARHVARLVTDPLMRNTSERTGRAAT